jgi:hypothetical protein
MTIVSRPFWHERATDAGDGPTDRRPPRPYLAANPQELSDFEAGQDRIDRCL